MTALETRIREALRASAELPVSLQDIEQAGARFRSGRPASARRPRALLVAATVAVTVGATLVWWLARPAADNARPIDRPTQAPQPTQTTTPTADDRVGFVGPPPPGTPASGPATGQLVAAAVLYHRGTWVYADGRIINVERHGINDEFNGYWVRQLAPLGVEAMRSFLLDGTSGLTTRPRPGWALRVRDGGRLMFAREFNDCQIGTQYGEEYCPRFTNPEDWLPASAWEDPTFRAFVPHSYQVGLVAEHSPAEALPAEAVDILMASPGCGSIREVPCWVLANSVARELADIIDQAGSDYVRLNGPVSLAYELSSVDGLLAFEPVLPHGAIWCSQCG